MARVRSGYASQLRQCLYCRERKAGSAFNREHVMPRAFGTFEQNMVLRRVVCWDCNQFFGDKLDNHLGWDSFEGYQMHEMGLKRPAKPGDRVRLGKLPRLSATLRGTIYEGALLEWRSADDGSGNLVVFIVPQVGVGKSTEGPFTWFALDSLPHREDLKTLGIASPMHLRIWGCEMDHAQGLLTERGFKPKGFTTERLPDEVLFRPDDTVPMTVNATFDATLARAIAKIAMNYLAHEFEGAARMPHYMPTQRFIRNGEGDWRRFVSIDRAPVIGNVSADVQLYLHVVAVAWDPKRRCVYGQVSLLGWAHYRVELGDGFLLPQECVSSGHAFDPHNREIRPLSRRPQPAIDLSKHIKVPNPDEDK